MLHLGGTKPAIPIFFSDSQVIIVEIKPSCLEHHHVSIRTSKYLLKFFVFDKVFPPSAMN